MCQQLVRTRACSVQRKTAQACDAQPARHGAAGCWRSFAWGVPHKACNQRQRARQTGLTYWLGRPFDTARSRCNRMTQTQSARRGSCGCGPLQAYRWINLNSLKRRLKGTELKYPIASFSGRLVGAIDEWTASCIGVKARYLQVVRSFALAHASSVTKRRHAHGTASNPQQKEFPTHNKRS